MSNILVTGGAGFIGSNFLEYMLDKYPEYKFVNLDSLTYAGNLSNLQECEAVDSYTFVHGDVCNRGFLKSLFTEYNFSGVVHFAAESHVDNSISDPDVFIKTNVLGTHTLIDVAKKHWLGSGRFGSNRFHHISTDEVYGSLGPKGLFSETTPYAPNSPYAASKASSDMIVRAYHETYKMNTLITNCSNNYGPKQHNEKLIPTIIRKALNNELIPIYGDGKNIRDWLYVLDHCIAIDMAFHNGIAGETYNIGGYNEKNNLFIANEICEILDVLQPSKSPEIKTYKQLISFVEDRAGHDRRYAIDPKKIEEQLGWKAIETFDTGILKTVKWYLEKS